MTYYSTVTSKGQITLPAKVRRDMNLKAGQRVCIALANHRQVNISVPESLDEVRAELQANLKKQGFTTADLRKMAEEYRSGDGFTAHVKEKYGTNS
jgi:AbrB family looped-hinge helix DNA binding protein